MSPAARSVPAALPGDLRSFWVAPCPGCPVMKAHLADPAAEFPEPRIGDHEVGFSGEEFRLTAAVATQPG